jgi:hypothetical protein
MSPSHWNDDEQHFLVGAGAPHATDRADSKMGRLMVRAEERAYLVANLRAILAAYGIPESIRDELDHWNADLAFACAELREMNEMLGAVARRSKYEHAILDDLFHRAPGAQLLTSDSAFIDDGNIAAARLLAMGQDALRGKALITFVARQDTRVFRDWLRGLAATHDPQSIELRLRPRGGIPFPALLSVHRLRSPPEGGAVLRWTVARVARTQRQQDAIHDRMQRAIRDLGMTFSVLRASVDALNDRATQAGDQAEAIGAIARAVTCPAKSLEDLQDILEQIDGDAQTAQ